jgi:hypothetical protein
VNDYFGKFWMSTQSSGPYFWGFSYNKNLLILTKIGLGYILGNFFMDSSGQPICCTIDVIVSKKVVYY